MTDYLSRRERREAERAGLTVESLDAQVAVPEAELPESDLSAIEVPVSEDLPVAEPTYEIGQQAPEASSALEPEVFLSRRARRLAEAGSSVAMPPALAPEVEQPAETASPEVKGVDQVSAFDLEAPEIDYSADFTGNTLLAEPSTQSIVLDVAPEAISLPLDTGEIVTTGSISILAEPATGSITGGLDGLALDQAGLNDAVTGVISIVEPVSALDVINERVNVGVVPSSVLRRGWWQPWALGALGIALTIATILAAITILEAIGN